MDVARHWAGGGSTLNADAAAFGLVIEGADEEDDEVEIWPENRVTVDAFLACQTQWSVNEFSGTYTGLRYADVAAALDMLGVVDKREVFWGIRTMEREALDVLRSLKA
ncbi:MAG: DUF1799 domain-containing protein [Hydrogenophilales bacterium]|nr:DUF1799 domain-containing protein [Hydrogenophilales bacterium]